MGSQDALGFEPKKRARSVHQFFSPDLFFGWFCFSFFFFFVFSTCCLCVVLLFSPLTMVNFKNTVCRDETNLCFWFMLALQGLHMCQVREFGTSGSQFVPTDWEPHINTMATNPTVVGWHSFSSFCW